MRKSVFFYKELTQAEVGKTGTHEIYIRLPNNFDYEAFFGNIATENGSVLEVNFTAIDTTNSNNDSVNLRFVYFINSNREKRIPSLGELFKFHNVQEEDIVCIESRENSSKKSFYIHFYKKGEITISPSSIFFMRTGDEIVTDPENILTSQSLQQIFYGAPGTGKSNKIKKLTSDESVIRTTFHPDSDYSTFVGAYKPTMTSQDRIYSVAELKKKLAEIKNPYPCQKFGAEYWKSLSLLSSSQIEDILTSCGFTLTMSTEVSKGIAIGQAYLNGDKKIVYKFIKQAFLKAYLLAWKEYSDGKETTPKSSSPTTLMNQINPNIIPENKIATDEPSRKPVYLVIEEINRGNCAQIFGDLFQLLDRSDNNFSEYPIEADTDIQKAISDAFNDEEDYKLDHDINVEGMVKNYTSTRKGSSLSKDIQDGHILLLPPNLYIWATMNTSDQSLFPIDSAFKRRWDWVYLPIGYKNNNWIIEIGEKKYNWVDFQREINNRIYGVDNSEDKQLGDYFVNADRTGNVISADTFLNKILFYIWNDVCKDDPDQIFRCKDDKGVEKSIKFSDFFADDRDKKLQGLMRFLGVNDPDEKAKEPKETEEHKEEEATPTEETTL